MIMEFLKLSDINFDSVISQFNHKLVIVILTNHEDPYDLIFLHIFIISLYFEEPHFDTA